MVKRWAVVTGQCEKQVWPTLPPPNQYFSKLNNMFFLSDFAFLSWKKPNSRPLPCCISILAEHIISMIILVTERGQLLKRKQVYQCTNGSFRKVAANIKNLEQTETYPIHSFLSYKCLRLIAYAAKLIA